MRSNHDQANRKKTVLTNHPRVIACTRRSNENVFLELFLDLDQIIRAFRILVKQENGSDALSLLQAKILIALRTEKSAGIVSLAKLLGITPATVSDSVRVLVAKEMVTKERSRIDRRSIVLSLTSSGKKSADLWITAGNEVRMKIACLNEEDQKTFIRSLMEGSYRFRSKEMRFRQGIG